MLASDGTASVVDQPAMDIAAELLDDGAPLAPGTESGSYRIGQRRKHHAFTGIVALFAAAFAAVPQTNSTTSSRVSWPNLIRTRFASK